MGSINSYAQNFEDVMLWWALGHISNGFYIDVGAWSPDTDSVTRLFYEKGWRGINIEPNPKFHKQYLHKRAEDINLNVAVSDEIGTAEIYFVSNPGLSSLDKSIAQGHVALGLTAKPSLVNVTTLSEICETFSENQAIHFLKVDVEGFEKNVFLGNDWKKYRPWIIVAEATLPMTQVENYEEWEYILLDANYLFVYADGLNRFYLAEEHKELLKFFKYPPNVFDNFSIKKDVQNTLIYNSNTVYCELNNGFHIIEPWGVWCSGKLASMSIGIRENQNYPIMINLKIALKIFAPLLQYSPLIKISQQESILAYVLFRSTTQELNELSLIIHCENEETDLIFEITNEGSPMDFGSVDNRILSFGMTILSAEIVKDDEIGNHLQKNPHIIGILS